MHSSLPIILASASARRVELLKQLIGDFQVVASSAPEVLHDQFTGCELAQANAFRKALVVARRYPDCLVLGADTVVSLDGEHFGKPLDLADARRILEQLQGKTHQVVTGVCLLHWKRSRRCQFAELTEVRFHPLDSSAIDRYLASINPLDKAGAYAIQEGGAALVASVRGSFTNVVGLPLERLWIELRSWPVATKPLPQTPC